MNKIKILKLLLLVFLSAIYLIWRIVRPIEIVDVHVTQTDDIVIRNPPLTDKALITWWEENKEAIQKKYGIPRIESNGSFSVDIWDIGDGYEKFDESTGVHFIESAPDQFCFENMKAQKNCLSKDKIFASIYKASSGVIRYSFGGNRYRQKKNGEIVKDTD